MENENSNPLTFSPDINVNMDIVKKIFQDDETLIMRIIENQYDASIQCCLFFLDGMVDNKIVNDDIVRPLQQYRQMRKGERFLDVVARQIALVSSAEKTTNFAMIEHAVEYGDSVLLVSGCNEALVLNSKGWKTRAINEPENEKVMRGPREGFNESILVNLSMVRRKLRTADLKVRFRSFGARSKTRACICYLDSLVNKNVLTELNKRLDSFLMDGTLDVNYISEFIKDAPYSPVKTIGSTERPDVVAGKLLEGCIALFLDGTPMVLTLPFLFIEHFQSDDDYYLNFFFASIGRVLRLLAFFITTCVPAAYVALTTFHQEMIPTELLVSIYAARQGVPFPSVIEAFMMLIVFEILREAGTRMPNSIGQALSIVGALVLGQAAVQAKIVSAPMIIVVSITGITGLMIPKLKGGTILLRFALLVLSSIIGLYGVLFGLIGLLIHLSSVSSFGIPVLNDMISLDSRYRKDVLVRCPWWSLNARPKGIASDIPRQSASDKGRA